MCLQRQISCAMPIEPSNIVFTPTTLATMESTLSAFENELTQSSDCFSDDDSSQEWPQHSATQLMNTGQANGTRRLPGPKSNIRTEDMTAEEVRRRDRRRERNKLAAARCRQRRLDITNQLLAVSIALLVLHWMSLYTENIATQIFSHICLPYFLLLFFFHTHESWPSFSVEADDVVH